MSGIDKKGPAVAAFFREGRPDVLSASGMRLAERGDYSFSSDALLLRRSHGCSRQDPTGADVASVEPSEPELFLE